MSDRDPTDDKKARTYYDGDCPMCRAFVAKVEPSAKDIIMHDFRRNSLPDSITADDAERKIHFVDANGKTLSGAAAVLAILQDSGRLKLLTAIGTLPGFRVVAEWIYDIVAANRFFIFGPYQRLFWLKFVAAWAFLIPLIITRRLWFGESSRFYPLTPLASWLPEIDWPFDRLLVAVMCLLLVAISAAPRPRRLIAAFCLLAGGYSLLDQSRWMPYNYQFFFMFACMLSFSWRRPTDEESAQRAQTAVLAPIAAILVGIWLWSGLHKLSVRYLLVGYPWMVSPFAELLPETGRQILHAGALLSTAVESGGAIGLLFPRTRNAAVLLIALMHCFILLCFGPLGLNFNYSVWSWNIAQIAFCFLVFWKNDRLFARSILRPARPLHALIILLFLIMPALNRYGLWDDFLSHALYSWTTTEAEIHLRSAEVKDELPAEVQPALEKVNGSEFIHILKWSYGVFESPPYHAHRVFKNIFRKVCEHVRRPEQLQLVIFEKPGMFTGRSQRVYIECEAVSPLRQ